MLIIFLGTLATGLVALHPDVPSTWQGFIALAVFCYLLYCVVSCCTNSTKYINNVVNINKVFTNIDAAIQAPPEIKMIIQNWHYQRKTWTDRNGKKHHKKVRVNTHRAEMKYYVESWVDRSPPSLSLHYIDLFLLTRIFTEKIFTFSPTASRSFAEQKRVFIHNHHRDKHYDFSIVKDIPFHNSHVLAYNDTKGTRPWFTKMWLLVLMDFVFMGWLQRYKLDFNSVRVEYYLEKYIIS